MLKVANKKEMIPEPCGNLARIACTMGLIHPKYYEIIRNADGRNDIKDIAEAIQRDYYEVKAQVQKLADYKLFILKERD